MFIKGLFLNFRRSRIKFVYETDLEELLNSLNIREQLGNSKCIICDDLINIENLGALQKRRGKIEFICNKPVCLINCNNHK